MDGQRIWEEAQAGHAIGPNAAPKLPATLPGFVAMERVVERGWPVIVTEVFSLDQVVATCELYLQVTARTGVRSPFFMSPITGILGDHLKKLAKAEALDVPARAMDLAGIGLARRCAALVTERAYPVTLLFGGARIPEDLTGLVGDRHHATINWSTFAEILAMDPPIERTIDAPFDPDMERTLLNAFPDVRKAWEVGCLAPEEFEAFGPVQHFRDNFLVGWHGVLAMIADRRNVARAAA
jgi:transaldolase